MKPLSPRYVYALFEDLKDHEILMCYFGNISFKISNHLINTFKENLNSEEMGRHVFKRVYSSFVECIENITRHTSADTIHGNRFGILNVSQRKDYIIIHSGNMVETEDVEELEGCIKQIKRRSQQELKEDYRRQIMEGQLSSKGGARLGMLQVALNCEGNLEYNFQDVDDTKKFFLLEVRIKTS